MLLLNLRSYYSDSSSTGPNAAQIQMHQSNFFNMSQFLTLLGPQTAQIVTPISHALSLKYILHNNFEWIIVCGQSSQRLRINLFSSLFNFMHIVKGGGKMISGSAEEHSDQYVLRLDKTMTRSNTVENGLSGDQVEMTIEVLALHVSKFIDILCHDCIGGHDVCKILALSYIDVVLELNPVAYFIQFISRRGYLSNQINSLLKIDNDLCRILDAKPDTLKSLYVYEHPDFQVTNFTVSQERNTFVPPVEVRFQQVLFPALNLLDVIQTTLGIENHSSITQIVYFLLSHSDMIKILLRAGTPFWNLVILKELSAITSLIARVVNQEISTIIDPQVNQDLGAHFYRLEKLMLTLITCFIIVLLPAFNLLDVASHFFRCTCLCLLLCVFIHDYGLYGFVNLL